MKDNLHQIPSKNFDAPHRNQNKIVRIYGFSDESLYQNWLYGRFQKGNQTFIWREKAYLEKNWGKNMDSWGIYAGSHSTLLMQMNSTNALESYHRDLKSEIRSTDGFVTSLKLINDIFAKKLAFEEKANAEMFQKQVSVCSDYPFVGKFALPFQILMAEEIKKAYKRVTSGEELRERDKRKYSLPFHLPSNQEMLREFLLPRWRFDR